MMSTFQPIRTHIGVTTQKHRQTDTQYTDIGLYIKTPAVLHESVVKTKSYIVSLIFSFLSFDLMHTMIL